MKKYDTSKEPIQYSIQWPRSYGKSIYWEMVKKYYLDWEKRRHEYSLTPMLKIDPEQYKGNWSIGIDMGEKDMCGEGTAPVSYREKQLEERVQHYERNHLGAETERFIEMARELGQNDHVRHELSTTKDKLHDSNVALMRANENVAAYAGEAELQGKRARQANNDLYDVSRRYEDYKKKHRKPVAKKAVAKKKK